MKAKRKHVLEDIGEQTFFEFYNTSKNKDVIQQIYNYMGGNELRYSIFTIYDNHWFLRREHTELWISKTLPLEFESPLVLKVYAYLTQQAKENPKSPKPQVLVPTHGDNNSRTLRSHSKSSSNSSLNQQQTSSTSTNQQSSSNIPKQQKTRAIKGLEAIHKYGILYNDIQEENILINDNGVIFLIDFGMASRADTKKKRKLFEEEQLKLSQLLDRYIVSQQSQHVTNMQNSCSVGEEDTISNKKSQSHKKKEAENIVQDVFDFMTTSAPEKNHMTEISMTGNSLPVTKNTDKKNPVVILSVAKSKPLLNLAYRVPLGPDQDGPFIDSKEDILNDQDNIFKEQRWLR
ncbi:6131_t:CDS:2 [Funneliformis geosporum]|nr:6131_t:CDS:2 [Funneliformis geosporum]